MVERRDKFSSKHFYAVNFEGASLEVNTPSDPSHFLVHSYTIPAVWFKTKAGVRVVSEGFLRFTAQEVKMTQFDSVELAFVSLFDGRYGGSSEFQWDGERMFAPGQTFEAVQAAQGRLQGYLDGFPAPPTGFEGWFSIKETA